MTRTCNRLAIRTYSTSALAIKLVLQEQRLQNLVTNPIHTVRIYEILITVLMCMQMQQPTSLLIVYDHAAC
jgi:hypothetical protein